MRETQSSSAVPPVETYPSHSPLTLTRGPHSFALDFMEQLLLVAGLWSTYLAGVNFLFFRWRREAAPAQYNLASVLALANTSGDDGGPSAMARCGAVAQEFALNITGIDRSRNNGEWILLECILVSGLATFLLLHANHR